MESFGHPGTPKKLIKALANQFKKANGRGTQKNGKTTWNWDSPEPPKVGFGSRGVLILTNLPKRLKVIQKAAKSAQNGDQELQNSTQRPFKRCPGRKEAPRPLQRGRKGPSKTP
jgi:hypothetical protein